MVTGHSPINRAGHVELWFLSISDFGRRHATLENRIATAGFLAGIGFAAFAATAVTQGTPPVLYFATVVGLAGFLPWAVWLRRGISTGSITESTSPLD